MTSAAGGIGRLVVQYARDLGAKVVGAAGGPAKVAAVRKLGADLAVDYNEHSWEKTLAEGLGLSGRAVTVVLDGVGGDKARAAFESIADGGRYVTIGNASQEEFEPAPETLAERDVTAVDALTLLLERPEQRAEFEARALAAAGEGRLVPTVQTFPLSEAAAAHAALEARSTTGKVVLMKQRAVVPGRAKSSSSPRAPDVTRGYGPSCGVVEVRPRQARTTRHSADAAKNAAVISSQRPQ